MNSRMAVLLLAILAAGLGAQVPAPDFVVDVPWLQLNAFQLDLQVQGPPSAPFAIVYTLQNPFTTPPGALQVQSFVSGALDSGGQWSLSIPIAGYQGPLPDVWFGTIVYGPFQPVLAGVFDFGGILACVGCGNPLETHAVMFYFDRGTNSQAFRIKTFAPNEILGVWEVDGDCPDPGDAWLPGGNATFIGPVTTDAAGNGTWTGTVTPAPGKCLVVRTNGLAGVVVGVKRY